MKPGAIDEPRRQEIVAEERVRADAQREIRDSRFTDALVGLLFLVAPAANLLALGNRSWPYWAWLAVGVVVAAVYARRRGY